MGSVTVDVKWQKETLKGIVIDTNESPAVFKSQLFSLTGGHIVGPSSVTMCPILFGSILCHSQLVHSDLILCKGQRCHELAVAWANRPALSLAVYCRYTRHLRRQLQRCQLSNGASSDSIHCTSGRCIVQDILSWTASDANVL